MKKIFITSLLLFTFEPLFATEKIELINKISLNEVMQNASSTHNKIEKDVSTNKPYLRDFRVVLPGVLYRGGNSGGGQKPISGNARELLCNSGFSQGVYMYTQGYSQDMLTTKCERGSFEYVTFGGSTKDRRYVKKFLTRVRDIIVNKKGPMYLHCWNGWHASGEMAAYSLMQFCGLNGQQAYDYWFANRPNGIISRIKNFQTFEELNISTEDQARVCPR